MRKIYKIAVVLLTFFVTFTQTKAQVANCCAECQADVKAISDKQVLLEKIEISKDSLLISGSINIYVSYRSGNSQKFWTNLAIASAGIAVSTQLGSNSSPMTAGDSRVQGSSVSPAIPLGVSVALFPSIWKNRPRGVPQAGLYVQHRDLRGKLTQTWEQPISSEAKNSAELLTVAIDKPLSEGSLEVYLQNGSKNEVFYWGLQTVQNMEVDKQLSKLALPPKPKKPINETGWCPWGWFEDGWGNCIDPDTYWSTYAGENSTLIDGVTVTAPRNGGSGNGGWNNGLPSGDNGNGSGGSGSGGNNNGQQEDDPRKKEYQNCVTCKQSVTNSREATKDAALSNFLWTSLWLCTLEGGAGATTMAGACAILEIAPGPGTVAHGILTSIAFIGVGLGCIINESQQYRAAVASAEASYWTGLKDCGDACPN